MREGFLLGGRIKPASLLTISETPSASTTFAA
jgi:hypothetical protein